MELSGPPALAGDGVSWLEPEPRSLPHCCRVRDPGAQRACPAAAAGVSGHARNRWDSILAVGLGGLERPLCTVVSAGPLPTGLFSSIKVDRVGSTEMPTHAGDPKDGFGGELAGAGDSLGSVSWPGVGRVRGVMVGDGYTAWRDLMS